MKKLFAFICLSAFAVFAFCQEPNKQLQQLEKYLQESGCSFFYSQYNEDGDANIKHRWTASLHATWADMPVRENQSEEERKQSLDIFERFYGQRRRNLENALDSIRLTFARLGKKSSESYLYEYHKDDIDTIKYALAFARPKVDPAKANNESTHPGDSLVKYTNKYNNSIRFYNAREAVNFDYSKNMYDSRGQLYRGSGIYTHVYTVDTGLSLEKDLRPFDIEALQALIQPVIKSFLSLKGAKENPVYWSYDGKNETTITGSEAVKGLTTGQLYFVPIQYEAEVEALYRQLDSLVHDYVNRHPEQAYNYGYRPFPQKTVSASMVEGNNFIGGKRYNLRFARDKEGFYILSLIVKGDSWIPDEWKSLKSYINGEKVYIKGKEPNKEKDKKK